MDKPVRNDVESVYPNVIGPIDTCLSRSRHPRRRQAPSVFFQPAPTGVATSYRI